MINEARPNICIWAVPLSRDMTEDDLNVLSVDERARANRFKRPNDRVRWIVAHADLRRILGVVVGSDAGALQFAIGERGKPRLIETCGTVDFSLAHAHDLALVAVANCEIGVDVEHLARHVQLDRLCEGVLSQTERSVLDDLETADRQRAFLALWCVKEAVLKACGIGIGTDLSGVSALVEPDVIRRLNGRASVALGSDTYVITIWQPNDEYVAAVATRCASSETKLLKWGQA
jgi:4'-phosphopantetheinyl transferase